MIDRALRCPKCCNLFKEQIYLCQGGHSVCNGCYTNMKICPTCKGCLGETRNHALEDIISELPTIAKSAAPSASKPQSGKFNCSICRAHPSSIKEAAKFFEHYSFHMQKLASFARYYHYQKVFRRAAIVEQDFMILKRNSELYKFCIKVDHSCGKVFFAMQMLYYKANYLFEIEYVRITQNKKILGTVTRLTFDEYVFGKGCAVLPISEFLQVPEKYSSVNVKVTCEIKENSEALRSLMSN